MNPQDLRTLSVRSPAIPERSGRSIFEAVRISGHEGINSLFEYEVFLKTPEDLFFHGASESGAADLDLDAFLGREITCRIELDGAGTNQPGQEGGAKAHLGAGVREINALIADAAFWGEEGRHLQYRLTLRPWLHLASLKVNCRIFQDKTVVQILDELLGSYIFPVDKRLYERYPTRDFQTQFNESDFEFFERMCQEWGISYHFEHGKGSHRLVLCDAMAAYKPNASEAYRSIEYHAPGWKVDAEYLHSFVPVHRLTSGRYVTRDYDYTRPRADLTQQRSDPRRTLHADGEVFQWHDGRAGSHFAQPRAGADQDNDPQEEGRLLSWLRMQALRTEGVRAGASGNLRGMCAGSTFRLRGHPRDRINVDHLILDTRLLIEEVGENSQVGGQAGSRSQQWRVRVDLRLIPVAEQLRPTFTRSKPHTHGPQTALVVGPEGQNIWTDQFGRIKVQFSWDREGQNDQRSSCWVRVASPWAGNQLGGVHLPRIGQEVIVDFLGGDPDLPICTGRVHNQTNLPPWSLPGQAALSGFRSRELTPDGGGNGAAGRSNHVVLDDTEKKIQVQVKSDHQHSQLGLGAIGRIEGNAGREEDRGEGFELRTDGAGAVRADKGLLLSTDGRAKAVGGVLSRDELVRCLEQALAIARDLGDTAVKCNGAVRDVQGQKSLGDAVEVLGHGTGGEPDAAGSVRSGQPVLAMSGAAGIATATPRDHTQYAGANIDTVAGRNQQHYAQQSILQSAGEGIEQFAHHGDIRTIASEGKVITQAQHNGVAITARHDITLTSSEDEVVLCARKGITLVLEDGTYLRLAAGKAEFGMPGPFVVKSAGREFEGPATLAAELPSFYRVDQAMQVKLHNNDGKEDLLPQRKYQVFKASGITQADESDVDAISKLKPREPFDLGR